MQKINRLNQTRLREEGLYDITDAIQFQKNDIGRFILRLSIGGLMLFHGMHKVIYGNAQVHELLNSVGIPPFFSFGVFIGEILAPICLIIGYKVRLAGFFLALNMLIAVLLVHSANIGVINQGGGWSIELNALYFLGAISIMFLGSGHIAITKGKGTLD
jgi:putative oxidoreductase